MNSRGKDAAGVQAEKRAGISKTKVLLQERTQHKTTDEKLQRSEMQLRETQSFVQIGSFSYNIEADEMEWSDEMYYIHGYRPGDRPLSLSGIIRHVHPSDKARVERIINQALQNRKDYAFTMLYTRPDGEVRHIHTIGRFAVEGGQQLCLAGTAQDVTFLKLAETEVAQKNLALEQSNAHLLKEIEERKMAEAALRESEEKWRSLVENTPDVISRFDQNLRFVFANNSIKLKLGLGPEDIVGKTYAELGLPEEISMASMASVRSVFETGKQTARYNYFDTAAGRRHYYSISAPEFDTTGSVKTVCNISRDITDVKRKESLLEAVLNSATSGIVAIEAIRGNNNSIIDFSFLHVNSKAQAILQRTAVQLQDNTLLEVLPGVKASGLLERYIGVVETGEPLHDTLYYGYDHLPSWYEQIVVKLDDGLVVTFADVNEQKMTALALEQANIDLRQQIAEREEAEQAARQEKELKASIIEHATDGISAFDKQGTYTAWNKTLEKYTGIKSEAVIGRKFQEVFPQLQNTRIGAAIDTALKGEHTRLHKVPFISRKGAYDAEIVPHFDQKGELIGGIFIVHDITETILKKEKAIAQNLSQQKVVLDAILEAQEEERKRIAETLHNGLCQLLYGIRLYLDQLDFQQDKAPDKSYKVKQQIEVLLEEAINDARNISYALTPTILEDFGLQVALRELSKKLSVATLTISLATYEVNRKLNAGTEMMAYRIIQELINNVLKHADATDAEIEVEQKEMNLIISVSDNGKGFNQKNIPKKGIGLHSITNRVKLLKGKLDIISTKNKGSKVKIVLPIES